MTDRHLTILACCSAIGMCVGWGVAVCLGQDAFINAGLGGLFGQIVARVSMPKMGRK